MLKGHGGRLPECFGGQGAGDGKVQCWEGAAFPACALEREECPGGFNPRDQKPDFLAGLSLTPGDLWTHSCSSRAFLVWAAGSPGGLRKRAHFTATRPESPTQLCGEPRDTQLVNQSLLIRESQCPVKHLCHSRVITGVWQTCKSWPKFSLLLVARQGFSARPEVGFREAVSTHLNVCKQMVLGVQAFSEDSWTPPEITLILSSSGFDLPLSPPHFPPPPRPHLRAGLPPSLPPLVPFMPRELGCPSFLWHSRRGCQSGDTWGDGKGRPGEAGMCGNSDWARRGEWLGWAGHAEWGRSWPQGSQETSVGHADRLWSRGFPGGRGGWEGAGSQRPGSRRSAAQKALDSVLRTGGLFTSWEPAARSPIQQGLGIQRLGFKLQLQCSSVSKAQGEPAPPSLLSPRVIGAGPS